MRRVAIEIVFNDRRKTNTSLSSRRPQKSVVLYDLSVVNVKTCSRALQVCKCVFLLPKPRQRLMNATWYYNFVTRRHSVARIVTDLFTQKFVAKYVSRGVTIRISRWRCTLAIYYVLPYFVQANESCV